MLAREIPFKFGRAVMGFVGSTIMLLGLTASDSDWANFGPDERPCDGSVAGSKVRKDACTRSFPLIRYEDVNPAIGYDGRGIADAEKDGSGSAIHDFDQAFRIITQSPTPISTGAINTCRWASMTAPSRISTMPFVSSPNLPPPT
jgi:hypothetical protein